MSVSQHHSRFPVINPSRLIIGEAVGEGQVEEQRRNPSRLSTKKPMQVEQEETRAGGARRNGRRLRRKKPMQVEREETDAG